jgi:hypothetical protein
VTVPVETVVFLLVGVHKDTGHQRRELRKAITALRHQGFTANVASAESIIAQADAIRDQRADQQKNGNGAEK